MKPACRVLSIDGGGIKGIIPCIILKEIEEKTGRKISKLFNLIAGTSTGGIIALGLTKKDRSGMVNTYSANDLLDLYVKNGKDIFPEREKDLVSRLGSMFEKTRDVTARNYDSAGIERLMLEKFGEARLTDALIDTLITTYDINSGRPYYFSSRIARLKLNEGNKEENILMRDVARSTSAAPTFFAPNIVNDSNSKMAFVDGGVFANNPSVLAYSEAKEIWKHDTKTDSAYSKGVDAIVTADDKDLPFFMLSLGCGSSKSSVSYTNAEEWRTLNWIQPLLTDIFMRSSEESVRYTMQYLLPPFVNGNLRYERLSPEIDRSVSQMDNVSDANIEALQEVATSYVKTPEVRLKIDNVCKILTDGWKQ